MADSERVACGNPECDVMFVPSRADHRFHSPVCSRRVLYLSNKRVCEPKRYYPLLPLLTLIDQAANRLRGDTIPSDMGYQPLTIQMGTALGIQPKALDRQLHRMKVSGTVGMEVADRWALGLGLHPTMIWDDWEDV